MMSINRVAYIEETFFVKGLGFMTVFAVPNAFIGHVKRGALVTVISPSGETAITTTVSLIDIKGKREAKDGPIVWFGIVGLAGIAQKIDMSGWMLLNHQAEEVKDGTT